MHNLPPEGVPEMTTPEFTNATWITSSHSSSNGGACVEVAFADNTTAVGVRDSKHRTGGLLAVNRAAWRALLHQIR